LLNVRLFIGVTYGGTPTFWSGGTVPPLFGRMTEKNNSDFPSSSART